MTPPFSKGPCEYCHQERNLWSGQCSDCSQAVVRSRKLRREKPKVACRGVL